MRLPLHLTIAEKAERLAAAHPDHAPAIQALARTLEAVNYGGRSLSRDEVDAAHEAWAAVVTETRRRRSWRARALGWFDVRRLFGDRQARLVARAGLGAGQPA